ncbi:hypothetical protein [Candidatus Poriferisocius sp.]
MLGTTCWWEAGLTPAVIMDTGYLQLLDSDRAVLRDIGERLGVV